MSINWRVFRDLEWTQELLLRIFILMAVTFFLIMFAASAWRDARGQFSQVDAQQEAKALREQIEKAQIQIADVKVSVQRSRDTLAQALTATKPQTRAPTNKEVALLRVEVGSLRSDVATMQTSLDALNSALLTSPDKALSIPLLRKDLDDFRAANQRDVDSIRLEMGRAYDLNKWLMGFLLAAVLGMIINNLIESKGARTVQPKPE